jgi:hypothetical protein
MSHTKIRPDEETLSLLRDVTLELWAKIELDIVYREEHASETTFVVFRQAQNHLMRYGKLTPDEVHCG